MTIKILQNCDDAHRQREGERHGLNPRPPAVKKRRIIVKFLKSKLHHLKKASKAGEKRVKLQIWSRIVFELRALNTTALNQKHKMRMSLEKLQHKMDGSTFQQLSIFFVTRGDHRTLGRY